MWVVAFSQDGRWSLALDTEGNSFRRDAATSLVATQKLDLGWVDVASYSPDGHVLVAAACSAGYAKVWETSTFREVATFRGFLLSAHSVTSSPDGTRLAVGSDGSEAVKLWDVESRLELLTLEGQGSLFSSLAFSPDANTIASLNARGQLHLWRAPSWAEIEATEKEKAQNR